MNFVIFYALLHIHRGAHRKINIISVYFRFCKGIYRSLRGPASVEPSHNVRLVALRILRLIKSLIVNSSCADNAEKAHHNNYTYRNHRHTARIFFKANDVFYSQSKMFPPAQYGGASHSTHIFFRCRQKQKLRVFAPFFS